MLAHNVTLAPKKVCVMTSLLWLQAECVAYQYLLIIIPVVDCYTNLNHSE